MINPIIYNTFDFNLAIPNTDLIKIIEESMKVLHDCPEILDKIKNDQDILAKQKKELRIKDKIYYHNKNQNIPGLNLSDNCEITPDDLELSTGRPRMTPQTLYLFMILRGYYGSVTDNVAVNSMRDSLTLKIILNGWNIPMPGATTVLENLNCLSNETRELIHKLQMQHIVSKELDDFNILLIDSTSVKGNTCWPTDSRIILSLLNRAFHYSQKLYPKDFILSLFYGVWIL
jgi:hypothetical protein